MKKILLLLSLLSLNINAVCVHEEKISGLKLLSNLSTYSQQNSQIYDQETQSYINIDRFHEINPTKTYEMQITHTSHYSDYDNRYIKYYHYDRILEFLDQSKPAFNNHNYKVEIVGKSIEGRNLYGVFPKDFDPNKKTILMFGRHHGDEGTANWIIEGFVNKFFNSNEALESFQLILYPMINPDGAENKVRYNKKSRDLNRVWATNPADSLDEVKSIHTHLESIYPLSKNSVYISLDMHGSFTEDFIYRVDKSFIDQSFFNLQQSFIDELGKYDQWQNANFQISNGHPKMGRIKLVRDHHINALTHETPRDIKLGRGRAMNDLKQQGEALIIALIDQNQ